ncbi:germination protein, Ger(x)C family [Evansella caseinilytica]|uniref:Germination protein, Ger(X)C family n=1 Tax=Evansella caseinilytica TaxID=1503961 RepID=A0A1H3U7X8_9BACI|nr:Ger(x)C family spore germination protein [Evansella caseinilytica]SDZ58161.1 germination protein, Ger(x)C family [Evansella caseinilytica]
MMVKFVRTSLLIICITLPLSGCWDIKDINHRLLPVTMGIAKQGEEYEVILQIPQPTQNTTKIKIVKETGKTITQAIDRISMNMESSVELLHLRIIIIDKETAELGIADILSGFIRAREVSSKTLLVICDEELDSFFANVNGAMESENIAIFDFFEKDKGWTPHIVLTRVWEAFRSIHSYTIDVAIPIVASGESTIISHVGSAVMKKGRMVDRVTSDESLLFNTFHGEGAEGKIEVMDKASVLIVDSAVKNKHQFVDNRPYLQCQINIDVVILEAQKGATNEVIKNDLEKALSNRFKELFAKIQANKADILGLGQYYRSNIPRTKLKEWRTAYYPALTLDVQFHVDIRNEGYIKNPS